MTRAATAACRRVGRLLALLALSLAGAACGPSVTTPAPGYPSVEGTGATFELTVDGVQRRDVGPLGAFFVDDAVVAKQHFEIAGTDMVLTVPSLNVGAHQLPDANGTVGALYDHGGFYDARAYLLINISGNDGRYVWGTMDAMMTDSFAATPQPAFPFSGFFAAHIN
jgi:hypothetical protein